MESRERLEQITAAFQTIIQELNLHPTRLDIELTMAETVHVYITAPEFSGKTSTERDLIIWPALEKKLSNLALFSISVCMLMAPEEETETLSRLNKHPSNGKIAVDENHVDGTLTPHAVFEKITTTLNKIIQERNIHPTHLEFELTPYETVHIYIEAPEFSGKTSTERELMLRPALEKKLPQEVIMNMAAFVLLAPEETTEEPARTRRAA